MPDQRLRHHAAQAQPRVPDKEGRAVVVEAHPTIVRRGTIDTTILGIALERIADPRTGLGASPGELQWAVGSYALLFATALFAAGALGDRYGHRTIMVLAFRNRRSTASDLPVATGSSNRSAEGVPGRR
ncbi:hypothetical protein GCM10010399_53630 [Dactylosporangium fulvum]